LRSKRRKREKLMSNAELKPTTPRLKVSCSTERIGRTGVMQNLDLCYRFIIQILTNELTRPTLHIIHIRNTHYPFYICLYYYVNRAVRALDWSRDLSCRTMRIFYIVLHWISRYITIRNSAYNTIGTVRVLCYYHSGLYNSWIAAALLWVNTAPISYYVSSVTLSHVVYYTGESS